MVEFYSRAEQLFAVAPAPGALLARRNLIHILDV
jgi:hypothetical protein